MRHNDAEPTSVLELLGQLKARNVPREQHAEYVRDFLDRKARKQGIPLSGKFELTPLCNLDCKMCYVHLNHQQMEGQKLLPLETWMNLMTQAAEAGMMEALLTGGECLTYPGFEQLYLHLQNLGVETVIYTNGVLLDKERIQFLKEHPPKDIQISLYGSSEDVYEKVTGHRKFQTVMDHIYALKEAEISFHIAITPSVYIRDDLENVVRLAHSIGVPYLINWSLFEPRENTGRQGQEMEISLDDYVRIYHLKWELDKRELYPVDRANMPEVGGMCNGVGKGLYCGGGRSSFSIGYDGVMYICGMLRTTEAFPIVDGFRTAWEVINSAAENYLVPMQCNGCRYRPNCPVCVVRHRTGAEAGCVNSAICERTMRMTQEGFFKMSTE